MSTLQQVQEFFRVNQLTPQSFVQFQCNTEGTIKFLSTFMSSDPVAVFAIEQFFPCFAFSLETAFLLKKENLLSLPGIQEIFIDKILTVLGHTKMIIQQLQAPLPGSHPPPPPSSSSSARVFTREDLILPAELKPQTRVHVEGITTAEQHEMVMGTIASLNPSIVQRPSEVMFITFEKSSSARTALFNIRSLFPTKKVFVESRKQLLKMTEKGLELYREFQNFEEKINAALLPHGTKLSTKKAPRKNDVRFYFEVPDGADEVSLLEIVCQSIVDLFNKEKGLIPNVIPEPEQAAEESIHLPSKIFQFVQKKCKFELRDIQHRTGIEFRFGPENVISFSGPESKVLSAKKQLKILTDSIEIDHFPRRMNKGEIEISQRVSFFQILDMLKTHQNKIFHSADVKKASIEFVGRNSDLLIINQEISRITESITTFHIDFSPSQLETWKSLISQNPDGLKGVYKTITSKCPVTMRFVDESSRLEIAGNRETIDQARQIIGDMINVNKVLFDFLSFSLAPQHSARA